MIRESRNLYRRSLALLESAEETVAAARAGTEPPEVIKARAAALQAAASIAKQVQSFAEMLARFEGLLQQGSQVNVAVAYLNTPQWKARKKRILDALEPHPGALEAVERAMED